MAIEFITIKDANDVSRNVACDLDGTNYYQANKVAFGADGVFTLVTAAVGLPVSVLNATLAATQSGTWNVGTVTSITNAVAITAASLPLPTGAATAANQATLIGHVDGLEGLLTTIDGDTGSLAGCVSGAELQVDIVTMPNVTISGTVAVSAASLPLPTGASTAAKQPALGTAGTASADVLTVQGIASMTALKVDGSAVTQPVSAASLPLPTGAATAANQTTLIGHVDGLEGLLTTIDADTGALAACASGSELQVDIVTMPNVTIANGTLAVTQSGTWNVGTLTSITNAVTVVGGAAHDAAVSGNPVLLAGYASATAPTAVSADGDAVRLWSDLSGRLQVGDGGATLSVDDGGSSLTVDGTVAATQSGTWTVQPGNTANTTAWLVTGTGGTFPATQSGTWNVGTVTTVTTVSAVTSITNAVTVVGGAAHDAAVSGNPLLLGAEARRARATAVSADGDAVRLQADRYGRLKTGGIELSVAAVDVTASGDTALIAAPGSGNRLKIHRIEASNTHATTALTASIKTATLNGGAVFGKKYLPAVGGQAVWVFPGGHLLCDDNAALNANLSAAGAVSYTVYYETIAT